MDEQRFQVWEELATNPIRFGTVSLPPVLPVALVLLALEQVLGHTLLRRVP